VLIVEHFIQMFSVKLNALTGPMFESIPGMMAPQVSSLDLVGNIHAFWLQKLDQVGRNRFKSFKCQTSSSRVQHPDAF
jgi:hypothetical protein